MDFSPVSLSEEGKLKHIHVHSITDSTILYHYVVIKRRSEKTKTFNRDNNIFKSKMLTTIR